MTLWRSASADGSTRAVGAAMADMLKETPMYTSYVTVAPHPEDFPKRLDKMGARMRKPYDWLAADVCTDLSRY